MKTNKIQLYLLIGIPVVGLILTTIFYFFVTGEGIELATKNQGVLIKPPKQISTLQLKDEKGLPYQWLKKEPKWTFLIVGSESCDGECQNKLFLIRQIHKSLGNDSLRVEVVYLDLNEKMEQGAQDLIRTNYNKVKVIFADRGQARLWFNAENPNLDIDDKSRFYLVDPAGWVMMYYTREHDYKSVIKDVKFLLKNS